MIGIFDSGVGGLCALYEVQRLRPMADICYFADRANAPFGIKDEKAICEIVKDDLMRLRGMGADEILVACCTACSVCPLLPRELMQGVHTIIEPAARAAYDETRAGHILVLSTRHTAMSRAFPNALYALSPKIKVDSLPSARLVQVVEDGARDGKLDDAQRRIIYEELNEARKSGADTVILGCTHFSHIEKTISEYLGMEPVSAAAIGAQELCRGAYSAECGRISYVGT